VRTPQSDFFPDGAPHVLGSITVASRSVVTFTGGVTVIPTQDGLGNNQPVTVRCALQSAANNTGIGVPVHAGLSQGGTIPITVQGIAEAGEWNILCLRVSQTGGFIAFAGDLTAVQVGF